ncbi:hypothetical protein DICPUDRAFT_43332 [Dictyostelium purpureum]|uniref:Conserved oligomeric Golgi complex subunit 6 n=1 Tax=Dictyostelium purpureum TaxID=5786 RepID=F1A3Z4_DICPU|nr:uncharacterized protein DICPUDRAFT_43332 [Dictyostelium purpureum]EGC29085.1 hypothetical protein DICPUDRAFT_43332 [Dictyostelium purpureum]|eukprot:XP_003294386.1 hypothetical protein DICPUDRAFT_43332 [Dictyostelium purpureum]
MNTTLSRKIQKVLEIKLDSKDLSNALEELSTFYTANSISARRNLRSEIEKRYLDINIEFLDQFNQLNDSINELIKDFEEIKTGCDDICNHLNSTNKVSSKLLTNANMLTENLKDIEEKEKLLNEFYKKFKLSQQEEYSLTNSTDIDSNFYRALDRLSEIQLECKKNLINNQYQKPTFEILEQINKHQETAYRRLYGWTKEIIKSTLQRENPTIESFKDNQQNSYNDRSDNIDSRQHEESLKQRKQSSMLPQALGSLQTRPLLLKHCLDEISEYRSKTISTGFITALSFGGPNGMPRPIEINAHDPQRYLGDMLAWIHQCLASEFELVSTILSKVTIKINDKINDQQQQQQNSDQQNSIEQDEELIDPILKVLNDSFECINRPLSIRVEQILQSKPGIIITYRMISLLDFYSRMAISILQQQIIANNRISNIFNLIKSNCLSVFFTQIKDHFDKLERSPTIPSHQDLLPTNEIKDSVNKLSDLLSTFNGSLIPIDEREKEYIPVFSSFIQKIINLTTFSATSSKLPLISMAVFMINSLSLIKGVLENYNFTKSNLELLSCQIEAHMDTLVEEQTSEILQQMGIGPKLSILQYSDNKTPLSQNIGMDRLSVVQSIRQFDNCLEQNFGSLAMPNCEKISDTALKVYSKKSVSNLISVAYSSLYKSILDPFNQYDEPNQIFQYKPDQIKTMLDI